ncbi:major facilitator superfamily domain-containing protein [Apiospora arundinis]|uniref:Major facilitator superfamily domain-containing protein n=1 Tax=Apiospora arundinis TaxID=335852 RepID=A0ABR2JIL9_9PEZI
MSTQAQKSSTDSPINHTAVASSNASTEVQKKDVLETGVQSDKEGSIRPHPRDGIPNWKWKAIVIGGAVQAVVNGYDVSNVANVQVPIYEAFGHIELLPWISLAFSLINVATIPLFRKLTGFMELKIVSFIAVSILIVGSALCGAAPSLNVVIVGRAFIGIGAAGCYQMLLTYNVIFAHPHEIALTQALIGASFAIGLLTGPIIGGAFAENEHATWRWAFYFVLPLAGIIAVACLALYPSYKVPTNKPVSQHLKEFDYLGCVLHMGTFVLLGLACIFSGPTWDWDSGESIAVWVLFGVTLIAYMLQQRFCILTTPENRIFPVSVLAHRAVALTAVGTSCAAIGYGATLYYTPIYFAFTRGTGALASAVRLLPFTGVFVFMMFLVGGLLPVVRYYMPFYLAGAIFMLIGAGCQQTITPESSEGYVMGLEALVGAGIGILWQVGVPVSSVVLPPHQRLDAAAVFNMAQLGGVAISLSIAGSIYQNVGFDLVHDAVGEFGYPDEDVRLLLGGVQSSILSAAHPEVVPRAIEAVTTTILRCFYLSVAAGALCFIAACCMKFEALEFKKPAAPAKSGEKTELV